MDNFRADLHCHTTCSDGSMTPRELVLYAKKRGLSALSITDHDTVVAYDTAFEAAKEVDLILGTGVEFSALEKGESVHILGYDIDVKNSPLRAFCDWHMTRRKERAERMVAKFQKLGIALSFDEVLAQAESPLIGRPHIAEALVKKGVVNSIQAAFDLYLRDGGPCYDPGEHVGVEQTIKIIHDAGGKAFLAHPHFLHTRFLYLLLEKGFDGIECYYARMHDITNKKWVAFAQKHKLLISGGSDFHGSVKNYLDLGCSWVDRPTFDKIFTNVSQRAL